MLPRPLLARQGVERERLWARWAEIDKNLDGYAALRSTETAVVVLDRPDAGPAAGPPATDAGSVAPAGDAR